MKNMRTLQKRIAYQLQQGSLDAEVTGITCDSRKVQPQNVFVCIRGNRMDGHVYAEEAVERGAAVLVAERELEGIPEKVTVLVVKDSREALAQLSCAWEDDPAQHLVTIGVTGTKGKTTTAYMIYEILRKAGIRAGLIGTIETRIGEKSIIGYVYYYGSYMYFDKDGTVVESSYELLDGIPEIKGLTYNHIVLNEKLDVNVPEVFGAIMDLKQYLDKYNIDIDEIDVDDELQLSVKIGNIKVLLGNDSVMLSEKIYELSCMVPKFGDKSGTLDMREYSRDSKYVILMEDKQ